MEQLGFEGMPRRLYTCTPTRLSSWLDCPRRYRMTYLDRPAPPKGPPWAHNSLGASIHNALAGWWRLPRSQRTVAAAGTLVDRGWINEGFADETQSVRQRERAIAMVEGYVAGLDPADEPLGVERTVATRTDKIAVSGRIDRLDARPAPPPLGRPLRRLTQAARPPPAQYQRADGVTVVAGRICSASAASQNRVSALAVVAGASTAGECTAAGMHRRRAPSRRAMDSCAAGDQELSFSP